MCVCVCVGASHACNAGDLALVPELGRSLGEGNGNPLQLFLLENSMDREAGDCSPWGCSESDTTEQLVYIYMCIWYIYLSIYIYIISYISYTHEHRIYTHIYISEPFCCTSEINIINQLFLKKKKEAIFKHRINCVSHQSGDLVTEVT